MLKRTQLFLAALVFLLMLPLAAPAQMQQEPPTFTMVSEWVIPRAQWNDYVAFGKKNAQPVFEKLLADGTIVGWGMFETIVHQEDRETHGSWFEATSIANLEKTLAELRKLPPNPIVANVKHHDFLIRSPLARRKPGNGTHAYLLVSSTKVQPGKGQEWRELYDKYTKPGYEEAFSNGLLVSFWIDVEQIHTDDPGWRYSVLLYPSADAMDKFGAAGQAAAAKRGAEANQAIGRMFADVTVAGVHRDYFARVIAYGQK